MIKIICVGKIKEKFLIDAVEEYVKRIKKYSKIKIIEVNDINDLSVDVILKKEKLLIEKYIEPNDFVICLDINGEELDSVSLAKKIDKIQLNNSKITFVVGGSYGIDESIKKRSDYLLSFSKLTFPHQLFRVLLVEQIYRSYKIMNNESYHK